MIHIIGSSGFLGRNLSKYLIKKKIKHKNFTRKKIKKSYNYSKNSLKLIKKDDLVIFFSAFTSVEKIEKNRKLYYESNKKIKNILKLINSKAYIIYISTDYVYSGNKNFYHDSSLPGPKNFYGKLKLDIEKYIKKNFNSYLILRSSKIFSNNIKLKTLYSETYKKLKDKKKLIVLSDQNIQLLNLENFIKIIHKIIKIKNKPKGNFNLPGKKTTRYEFSKLIAKKFKLDEKLIKPIKYNELRKFYLPKKLILKTNLYKLLKL